MFCRPIHFGETGHGLSNRKDHKRTALLANATDRSLREQLCGDADRLITGIVDAKFLYIASDVDEILNGDVAEAVFDLAGVVVWELWVAPTAAIAKEDAAREVNGADREPALECCLRRLSRHRAPTHVDLTQPDEAYERQPIGERHLVSLEGDELSGHNGGEDAKIASGISRDRTVV